MADNPTDPSDVESGPSVSRDEGQRESPRIDLEREVSLTFKEFRGFIREMSANLSAGGMFLKSSSPKPPDAIFDFEIKLEDETPLVHGIGKVVWTREEPTGPDRPAGMGIEFLALSGQSRELIEGVVRDHLAAGGQAFDPAARPESPTSATSSGTAGRAPAPVPATSAPTSSTPRSELGADAEPRKESASPPASSTRETTERDRPGRAASSPTAAVGRDRRPPFLFVLLLLVVAALVVAAVILF